LFSFIKKRSGVENSRYTYETERHEMIKFKMMIDLPTKPYLCVLIPI